MFDVDRAIEGHKWEFGYNDDEVQEFHDNLVRFLVKNKDRIRDIQVKHNKTFHLPYFTNNKTKPNEKQ